jgi:glycosyltransferase involved in cell wall biosynthesis
MQLVYLSPLPWSSFAQRPHKFVEWFNGRTGGDVLWVEPYPTRFPVLADFCRLKGQGNKETQRLPSWLTVIRPPALPVEPLPASGWVNGFVWRAKLKAIEEFARRQPTLLTIGKPSVLALILLKRLDGIPSVYDAMDDFPAFYSGLSRLSMSLRERRIVQGVTDVLASSTQLKQRWRGIKASVQLIHNGLDASALPLSSGLGVTERTKKVLGYVGTIGPWFNWEWLIALAKARPNDTVRLIGPIFASANCPLPGNIEVLPQCGHAEALQAMLDFDVGLIPFIKNELTVSVDPIKYYEYRALGLPVISTDFGEMALRGSEEGVFLSTTGPGINDLVERALLYRADDEATRKFIAANTWEARFTAARIVG